MLGDRDNVPSPELGSPEDVPSFEAFSYKRAEDRAALRVEIRLSNSTDSRRPMRLSG